MVQKLKVSGLFKIALRISLIRYGWIWVQLQNSKFIPDEIFLIEEAGFEKLLKNIS
jgi:hypothetical protein